MYTPLRYRRAPIEVTRVLRLWSYEIDWNPFPRLRNTLEVKQLPPLHYVVTVPINHGMHTGSVVNPPLHSTASGEEIGFALRHTSGCPFCMPAQYYRCVKCNVDNILATARVDHTFQDNP